MSCIADPTSPTELDPPLCGVCPKEATLTCHTCNNMQYCCAECQESDAPLHSTICTSFASFQERPSPYHYRAILFGAYEIHPRFIWLLMEGMRGVQDVNKDDWSQYCTGRRSSNITITTDQGISPPRQYNHRILVEYDEDSLCGGLPANLCLVKLCGPEVACFRGNYIARGYKYRGDTTPDQRDPCDIHIPGGCDIALDLDTTCLGPLVSWFREYVDFEDQYCAFQ